MPDPQPKGRLYGRKLTRPPGQERQGALDQLLPKLQITLPADGSVIDPVALFPTAYTELWLEIGFGGGEHVAGLMRRHPDRAYIGAEPFMNGMASFLKDIRNDPHDHIRVWNEDAILLVDALADHSVDGLYVLNPDPWPKRRHRKRRIISLENLDRFARILKPGGALVMASDVDGLVGWMVTQAVNHREFEWQAERASDWRDTPPDWITTRYEAKGRNAGRRQSYLVFKRC